MSPLLILLVLALILIFTTTILLSSLRLLFILQPLRGHPPPRKPGSPTHLLIVLGSGGHTAEMLAMLERIDTNKYTHRTYVVSEGDSLSATRAKAFEDSLHIRVERKGGSETERSHGSYMIWTVPRARKIHQSILTTPISCLRTLRVILSLLSTRRKADIPSHVQLAPTLILANGPATSAIVIFAQIILRFLDLGGQTGHEATRIVFVESLARVRTLSLSAKVIAWFVDRLIVQWEELKGKVRGKAEYVGLVVVEGLDI